MIALEREVADRIERCVAAAHTGFVELLGQQNGNRLGAEVRTFSDRVVATRVVGQPEVQWLQHVSGLDPQSSRLLPGILRWYAEHDLAPRFELAPERDYEALAAELVAAGFAQTEFVDLLWAPASDVRADLDDLAGVQVVTVDPDSDDAVAFGWVLLGGHEVAEGAPPEHAAALGAMAGVDGRRCYLALINDAAVGAAILTIVDGIGYLTNAGTVRDARERGAQEALIARRIADAEAAGCDVLAGLAVPFLDSHRNLARAGLQVAYTKVSWTQLRPEPPPS